MNEPPTELVNAIRETTSKLQHELSFSHNLSIAQIILLALILWRIW
jgi:hypothetical protein